MDELKKATGVRAADMIKVRGAAHLLEKIVADAKFAPIDNADKLARELEHIVGIVGQGLFVGMATKVILADAEKGLIEF